jgi:hypothetical protein
MLIKFVNSKAQLPSTRKILRESKDYLQILTEIGNELKRIFSNVLKQSRKPKAFEQHKSDLVRKGKLFVTTHSDKVRVPNIIMSLYSNHNHYPEPWQLLICTTTTTMEELTIFVKRCFFASNNGYDNHLFCITNLELLDFELQYYFVNYIKEVQLKYLNGNYQLALLCQKTEKYNYILDHYSLEIQEINELDTETMQEIYQELFPNILCVSSDLSGQGKTRWINEASSSKQKISCNFLISDNMDLSYLVNKLKKCNLTHEQSLHINILSTDYPEDVNIFLFELLTFKVVPSDKAIVSIPETFIFIEIASSIKQDFLEHLPIMRYLPFKHLSWNIKDFKVSQEIMSPIQVVCHFLNLYDIGKFDTEEIFFQTSNPIKNSLSEEVCQYLIMKYFLNESDKFILSFKYIEIFVNVLADQLIRFSSNQDFMVNNLKLKLGETNVRSTAIKSLLNVSKDFIIQSIKAKSVQLKTLTSNYENEIVQFDNSNDYILFFNSQTSNSFSILYRDKNKVPDNIKLLLKSQISGNPENWELDDYNTMAVTELLMKLEVMARRSNETLYLPDYALSIENLMKMALILLRVRANIPVVICGEAGCGKVSFDYLNHLQLDMHLRGDSQSRDRRVTPT